MRKNKAILGVLIAVIVALVFTGVYFASKSDSSKDTSAKTTKSDNNTSENKDKKDKSKSDKNVEKKTEEKTEAETETTTEQILDTDKVVYLTFDDGPSDLTPSFIDTLNTYGVHATFFVTLQEGREDIYKQILENGNKIQIHTASHDYDAIYQSVDAYIADFDQIYNYIYNLTGVKCDVFRFPGGSNNSYGKNITMDIAREMRNRGINYVDWNSSVGDGSASATKDSEVQKITAESDGVQRVVLLAHDAGTNLTNQSIVIPKVLSFPSAQTAPALLR